MQGDVCIVTLESVMTKINHPGWSNLKDMSELVEKSAKLFSAALAPAAKRAAMAFNEFGGAVYKVAEKEYLKCHARLPGGISNARLMKKRRTMVVGWFREHIGRAI